jgi:prepilin-type N-terminal cleavage/methylation domain-containing protein
MMLNGNRQRGFSLAEVLMALGILALGMVFIGGVFPAGLHYTIISTERTLGSVAADEAFAKIRLYGVDVNSTSPLMATLGCADFSDTPAKQINPGEFAYPSDPNIDISDKKYYWSALCRRVSGTKPGDSLVQVTVFVSRKTGIRTNYYNPLNIADGVGYPYPKPVSVRVTVEAIGTMVLKIIDRDKNDGIDERTFINAGSIIVENTFGRIYRVAERNSTNPDEITIERTWQGPVSGTIWVWVIPPPVGGGRQPCIGVFQKEMLF